MSRFSILVSLGSIVAACSYEQAVGVTSDAATSGALQRLHSAPNAVRDVDLAEKSAHAAQVALHDARNRGDGVVAAKNAYAVAENVLNNALVTAWTGYPAISAQVYTIEEPLQLAMLDLQAELRRRLGPNNHTVVEGLIEDPGCAGDVVQSRLVVRFGIAAQTIVAHELGTSAHPAVEVLNLMAHQVACLGAKQLAELEIAMSRGFEHVASRLRQRGYHALIPAFARLVAPLQLMILDVRKARGALSESQQWFERHQSHLLEATGRAGWASGDVLVWDRRLGVLVAYAPCASSRQTNCVDLATFLVSLADPRAMGTGRCSFTAMISAGEVTYAASAGGRAGDRYACPTASCDSTGTSEPIAEEQKREVEHVWGELESSDVTEMQKICRGGAFDAVGTFRDLSSCLDREFASLFADQNNPFDTFNECVLDGISSSSEGWMTGVPQGTNCELSDGGSTATSSVGPSAGRPPEATKRPLGNGRNEFQYTSSNGNHYIVVSGAVKKKTVNGEKIVVVGECTDCSAGDADQAAGQFIAEQVLFYEGFEEATRASDAIGAVMDDQSGDAVTSGPDGGVRPAGAPRDCADPTACNDDCTGMGQLMTAAEACTNQLLDAFAAATGRNKKEVTRRRDIVSYPRPDDFEANGGDNMGACFASETHRSSPACGLIICANAALAFPSGDECGCDSPADHRTLLQDLCTQVQCAEGTQPDPSTCECSAAEAITVGLPGHPEPQPEAWSIAGRETTLDWCLLDRVSGAFIYNHSADPATLGDTFGQASSLSE